jgi:hypothetical protein
MARLHSIYAARMQRLTETLLRAATPFEVRNQD